MSVRLSLYTASGAPSTSSAFSTVSVTAISTVFPVGRAAQDPELQLSDEDDPDVAYATNVDITNREVWTPASEYTGPLANVKAVAIDCTYASDDADDIHRSEDGKFLLQRL